MKTKNKSTRGRRPQYFFRQKIRKMFGERGLHTDTAIAQVCRLPQPTVSRFFRSGSCSDQTISSLTAFLGITKESVRDNLRHMRQAELLEASGQKKLWS